MDTLVIQLVVFLRTIVQKAEALSKLARGIQRCQRCERCQTRRYAVPGAGSPSAAIVLCGEAPGINEDATGDPFVGRARAYLDKDFEHAGF